MRRTLLALRLTLNAVANRQPIRFHYNVAAAWATGQTERHSTGFERLFQALHSIKAGLAAFGDRRILSGDIATDVFLLFGDNFLLRCEFLEFALAPFCALGYIIGVAAAIDLNV